MSTAYLDCNATSPLDPTVREVVLQYLDEDFGNAGSRTHEYGNRAKQAVQRARDLVATSVGAKRDEIIFTSGATESLNLAILGIADALTVQSRTHVVTSSIEHKAVLEPLAELARNGFEITFVRPRSSGRVDADDLMAAVRPETGLVCLMHVNNETGVIQPLESVGAGLRDHPAYFLVDAAQGLGKRTADLRLRRIDLMSLSAHKCYGPKGVGALVMRRRAFERPPLRPLMYGGGQERGLRPGTLPVHLIAGFGAAVETACANEDRWTARNAQLKATFLDALAPLHPVLHGDQEQVLPTTVNLSIPGIDSEAAIVALKGIAAISNGSACTSHKYEPSHVLQAMELPPEQIAGALRFSWCHMTPDIDFGRVMETLASLR